MKVDGGNELHAALASLDGAHRASVAGGLNGATAAPRPEPQAQQLGDKTSRRFSITDDEGICFVHHVKDDCDD